MKAHHRKLSKRAKRKLAMMIFDTFMKATGVGMFLIGLGALAEVPTEPRMIVRALGLFIGGICMIAWNSYIIDGNGDAGDRNYRR